MHMFMNDEDMNTFLAQVCSEGEHYAAAGYGTIRGSIGEILLFGALSNAYCYMGVTGNSLVVVETGAGNDCIHQFAVIPYSQITKLKLGSALNLYTTNVETEKGGLKMVLNKSKGINKCARQKENAKIIYETLKKYA